MTNAEMQKQFEFVEVADGGVNRRGKVMRLSEFVPPADVADVYTSMLRFPVQLMEYAAKKAREDGRASVSKYDGEAWAEVLALDFDSAANPQLAIDDARVFVKKLEEMGADSAQSHIYWSGKKGISIELAGALFGGFLPSPDIAKQLGRLARSLAGELATADLGIYDMTRLWRVPNTPHSDTGLYKVQLTATELFELDIDSIRELGQHPRPMTMRRESEPEAVPALVELYRAARQDGKPVPVTGDVAERVLREGERDDYLTSLAGTLRRREVNREVAFAALSAANESMSEEPLEQSQVEKVLDSVWSYKAGDGSDPLVSAPLTDVGNAERLVYLYGSKFRFNVVTGQFIVWDGKHWQEDLTLQMNRWAKATLRAVMKAAMSVEDEGKRAALLKHAVASEKTNRIDAMMKEAKSESGVWVRPEQLDANPMLLNVQNGTLDLATGELRPHEQGDMLTRLINVSFDPEAKCDGWSRFLNQVFQQNEGVIDFVQRAIGYTLTGDVREQLLFICYGDGANGKSTLLDVLLHIFGDFGTTTGFDTFDAERRSTIGNDLASLVGKRLVVSSEADQGRRLAEARIKLATGGDMVQCRFMYKELFTYRPQFKLWLAVNHKPNVLGTDYGIWRRIRLIPFARKFAPHEQVKQLKEQLCEEKAGILAWAVRGCLDWLDQGLNEPEEVSAATAEYREEMDLVGRFLGECCVNAPNAKVKNKALYEAFVSWCGENGETTLTNKVFGKELERRGHAMRRTSGGYHYRSGVRLYEPGEQHPVLRVFSKGSEAA